MFMYYYILSKNDWLLKLFNYHFDKNIKRKLEQKNNRML